MAYTPINWDEETPITVPNLVLMDIGIDNNDSRTTTLEGQNLDARITSNDGDILDIEAGTTTTNASTYKGNDIDTNGDGKVNNSVQADNATNADNADNADTLDGKHWVLINSGNVLAVSDSEEDIALRSGGHNYYRYSVYSTIPISQVGGTHSVTTDNFYINSVFAFVYKSPIGSFDNLRIQNHSTTDRTVYYEVYSWE